MSPNATVSAIQSLLRHLLFDTSGTSCWIVQDASTQKSGGDSAHVRASKLISGHHDGRGIAQTSATLTLHVHEHDAGDHDKLRVRMGIVYRFGAHGLSYGVDIDRLVQANSQHGFVDWAREIHATVSHLFDRIKLLHESCAVACETLLARVEETPSPDEIEDEPTQDPDSEPLSSDPEQVA